MNEEDFEDMDFLKDLSSGILVSFFGIVTFTIVVAVGINYLK